MQIIKSALFLLLLGFGHPAIATESLESSDIQLFAKKAHELAEKYGKEKVLLVYDIDNTLLTTNQYLGGDAWFNWQVDMIQSGNKEHAVAPDLEGLYEIQATLMSLGKMHPADKGGPALFNQLGKEGFPYLLLTSRGTNTRDATERELHRNGYNIALNPLGGQGIAGSFLPYDIQQIEKSCLSQEEAKTLKLGAALPATFTEGLFLTSGQHKGVMLRTLLCRLQRSFAAVVFLDDTRKHMKNMHDALDAQGIDVATIRYAKLDPIVDQFKKSDKAPLTAQWRKLKATLGKIFR